MYLLSLGSSNLFAKSMCLLLWCLLMSKATFGYLLGYIKASKSKLHQSKYSPRTHCGLSHIMYYVMLHHFEQCIFDPFVFCFFLSFLQFLEKCFLQFQEPLIFYKHQCNCCVLELQAGEKEKSDDYFFGSTFPSGHLQTKISIKTDVTESFSDPNSRFFHPTSSFVLENVFFSSDTVID